MERNRVVDPALADSCEADEVWNGNWFSGQQLTLFVLIVTGIHCLTFTGEHGFSPNGFLGESLSTCRAKFYNTGTTDFLLIGLSFLKTKDLYLKQGPKLLFMRIMVRFEIIHGL